MNKLYETDKLILENECEATFLIEKSSCKILFEDNFYGDPQCGLIDSKNNWAVVAGEHLTIWTPEKTKVIDDEKLKWIHLLRFKNEEIVEILIDPWSDNSSIWEINIKTFEYRRIRDFDNYKNKEYSEIIDW
jgi:hypothetical protein